jgi:hypothetical protein
MGSSGLRNDVRWDDDRSPPPLFLFGRLPDDDFSPLSHRPCVCVSSITRPTVSIRSISGCMCIIYYIVFPCVTFFIISMDYVVDLPLWNRSAVRLSISASRLARLLNRAKSRKTGEAIIREGNQLHSATKLKWLLLPLLLYSS